MTQEEKELLAKLLEKANENYELRIYDYNGTYYKLDWIFVDTEVCVKIKEV